MNDWFFSPPLTLAAGSYKVSFWYRNSGATFPEKLEVKWGSSPDAVGMTEGPIFDNGAIATAVYVEGTGNLTVVTPGVYYVGWHGYSAANMFYLCVDDISITQNVVGSLAGFVHEKPGCTAGLKSATVASGSYTASTGGDGSFLINDIPIGTYSFTASLNTYDPQTITGIVITNGGTTQQDFCIGKHYDPPANLAAAVGGLTLRDVHVSWQAPGSLPPAQWIQWDDGVYFTAVGLTGGGTFQVASKWSVADIAPYSGMYLKHIKFYNNDAAATYTLKVWKGTNAATPLHSQAVTAVVGYNDITLSSSIPIDGTQEFWFGYEVTHLTGTFPAGCDNGPNIEGKGNMIYSGGAWVTLYSLATTLPYNWIINGYLSPTAKGPSQMISLGEDLQSQPVNNPGMTMATKRFSTQTGTFAAGPPTDAPVQAVTSETTPSAPMAPLAATLTGYNVYRNTVEIIHNTPALSYDDNGLAKGGYNYEVSAVYDDLGESAKIGPVHVNVYTCQPPTAVDIPAGTIYTTSAIANWTASTITPNPEWIVEYGPFGFAHGAGTIQHVTSPTVTMTPLLPGTAYSLYVRTFCTVGDSSLWVGPYSFTTACPPAITSYPYFQNFDAATPPAIPACWSQYSSAAARPWVTNASTSIGTVSPPNFVGVFYSATAAKDEWLITPPMQFTPNTAYRVKFWVDAPGYLGTPELLRLVMSTDPSLAGMAAGTVLQDYSLTTLAYTEFTVPFTPTTAGPYYFGWYAHSVADVDYIAMDDVTFELDVAPLAITGANITQIRCSGQNNGEIVPTVTGGTTPYTYAWSNSATTSSISGLAPGAYSVTVHDAGALTATGSWTITEPAVLDVTGVATGVSCKYDCDGYINITPSGGTAPYTYLWDDSPPSGSQNISGLCAGFYSVTITDAKGCITNGGWTVTSPDDIMWMGLPTQVSCFGYANGSITTVSVSGGTPPYTYLWSNGAITADISGLTAGMYYATISDAHNCDTRPSILVQEPEVLALTPAPVDASCPTGADGKVILGVSGGTPAYNFLWSNGATTQDITGLNPGTYLVTVTDANGCSNTTSGVVGQVAGICDNISVSGDVYGPVCYNAVVTITVAGGDPPTTFVVKQPLGDALFYAGHSILFKPGTKVEQGAKMLGKITTSYCPTGGKEAIAAGQEDTPGNLSLNGFTLYPNPTNGNFTLVQKGDHAYGTVKVEVYSMSGERIMTEQMVGEKKHEFRFSDIPAGLYFVRVVADDYVETIKLIKTR
jgi:hypothetical protein